MSERSIFIRALEIDDPVERDSLLANECGTDADLRRRIERLLAAHAAAGGILDKPPAESPPTDLFRPITEGPGTIIGPYKLLQQIGEGGFGVVYMAEQQRPVRRKVALKIIKPGMDTREVIARFESERQALALMDHPNIARVLDAGATESGRPYFVMELVKGVPITEYCDKNALPTDKRLALFITVCHAVQHAHQKGVIHRDLKPSNVMVTLHDGQPVPKVIDFGVSKATSQQLTEKTLFTAYGQMIGTPAYMSPEQAEMSGLDIDTRSDTYSLGVLLYELLTGTTPFDGKRLREAGYVEMQRIIREEAPPRPSNRVSTMGNALTVVSSQRSTDPKKLGQQLRGDLDVIVMKAMEKERSRRYDTPNAFADDIRRFLNDEAIVARPASPAYHLKKFAQRNWAGVTAIAAIAAALLLGTTISTWLAIRATNASHTAQAERMKAETSLAAAVAAKSEAVHERDRAEKANAEESKQRQLAEEREADARAARQNEAAQLAVAKAERDKATTLSEELQREKDELSRRKEQQRRMLYVAQMGLIQKSWEADNVVRVQELLNATRPRPGESDLRGIEWQYWQHMLHQEERVLKLPGLFRTQDGPVSRPSFPRQVDEAPVTHLSPDGSRLAAIVPAPSSGSQDFLLQVWNLDSGSDQPVFSAPLPQAPRDLSTIEGSTFQPSARFTGYYRIDFLDAQRVVVAHPKPADREADRAINQNRQRLQDATPEEAERIREEDLRLREQNLGETILRSYSLRQSAENATPTSQITIPSAYTFHRDGSRLAAFASIPSDDQSQRQPTILILDGQTGETLDRIPCPYRFARVLALNHDASKLVVSEISYRRVSGLPSGRSGRTATVSPFLERPGNMIIFDVATRASVALRPITSFVTTACEFSPDGARLAICRQSLPYGATTSLIDTATGNEISSTSNTNGFSPRTRPTAFVAFSPDGKWLASAAGVDHSTHTVTIWDVAGGKSGPSIKGHTGDPKLVRFNSDGSNLVEFDGGGAVKTWRLPSGDESPTDPTVTAASVRQGPPQSPDGRWIARSPGGFLADVRPGTELAAPHEIQLTDVRSAGPTKTLPLSGAAADAAFSPDSNLLAVVSVDQTGPAEQAAELTLWSVAAGKQIVLPKSRFAAIGPSSGFGRGGPPPKSDSTRTVRQGPRRAIPTRVVFSPDNRRLAVFALDSTAGDQRRPEIRLWDVQGQTLIPVALSPFPATSPFVPSGPLVFSPDSKLLLLNWFSPREPGIQINDAATGALLWNETATITSSVFSADGSHLAGIRSEGSRAGRGGATARESAAVVIWNAATGERLARIPAPVNLTFTSLVLNHDASRVAAMTPASVSVYDVANETLLYSLDGNATTVEFTPDGQRIISSTARVQEMRVWDAVTGQELLSINAESPLVAAMAPVGRRLAPLAAHIEAESLVEWLDAADADGRYMTRAQIIARIKADPSLSEEVSSIALRLAVTRPRPAALQSQAEAIARTADLAREEYEQALETLNEVAQQKADDGQNAAYQGMAHYRLGDYPAALAALERSHKLYTAAGQAVMPAALPYLAMTHHQLGNAAEARKWFYQADRAVPSSAGRTFERPSGFGRPSTANGDSSAATAAAAAAAFSEASALLGLPSARALIVKGDSLRQQNQLDQAIAQYDAAIALDPENPAAYIGRGFARRDGSDYDNALADAETALRLDPKSYLAYNLRGLIYDWKRDYEQAIRDFTSAIELNRDSYINIANRGHVRAKKGDLDQALEDINAALRLNPSYAQAYYYRGFVWDQKRDYTQALADYDQAIPGMSEPARALVKRSLIHRRLGNYKLALDDLNAAFPTAKGNDLLLAHNDLAWLLATCADGDLRDGKKAVEHATKACDLSNWRDATCVDTLAAAQAEAGDFASAIKSQEQAITLRPDVAKKANYESRLTLYRAGTPYHEPPAATTTP